MKSFEYLIIGGGIAGHRAAEEIRKADASGTIAIVSDEVHRLYTRVLLPHFLHGKVPRERVFLVKPEWYAEQRIEHIAPRSATKLDTTAFVVTLDDGTMLGYKKLLLASGGHVRKLGATNDRQVYFRTLDDADQIKEQVEKLSVGAELSIVGSGFIALEFVNYLAARGHKAHLWYRSERFWQRSLDAESTALLEKRLRDAGFTLHPNSSDDEVAKGARAAAFTGIGIGITPSFQFLNGTGVKCATGILSNEYLETSVPNVWTAGDVAEYMDTVTGRQMVVGNWMNADVQGRHVGRVMAGARAPFRLVSSYATKLIDIHIIFIGDTELTHADKVEVTKSGPGVIQTMYRGGKLVGATLVNTVKERAELTKAIGGG